MNQQEYLNLVNELLANVEQSTKKEVLRDLHEHFAQGKTAGKTEEEIAASLGNPNDWVNELVAESKKVDELMVVSTVKVNTSFDEEVVEECDTLVIDGFVADVRVRSTEDDEVSVQLTDSFSKMNVHNYDVIHEIVERTYHVRVVQKQSTLFHQLRENLILTVKVPEFIEYCKVSTISGDISVNDMEFHRLQLHSTSGDIQLEEVEAEVMIETISGDIECEEVEGNLSVSSKSGDISLEECNGDDLVCVSTSGDVELEKCVYENAEFKSTSGDVELESELRNINVNTKSGDVEVACTETEAMQIKTISGDVEINVSEYTGIHCLYETISGDLDVDVSGNVSSINGHITMADQSVSILVKTTSGDLKIED